MKTVRNILVYIGTYTDKGSRGIYVHRFEASTGKITPIGLAAETSNPSFLAVHPNGRYLFAANENHAGTVSAFAIDPSTGMLKALNSVSSKGGGPCHLAFDQTGRWLFVANYNDGSLAVLPVHGDGTLGEASASMQHAGASVDPQRQAGPHAHAVNISPDNRFLLAADLGLDQVLTYRFDAASGRLAAGDPPFTSISAGSGPRHLTWSPDGKVVYLLNEMKATVTAMAYNKKSGSLKEFQTVSALPESASGPRSAAEIAVHPNGKVLYASNRGSDNLAIFQIGKKGELALRGTVASTGKTPRHFAIDPSGVYLFAVNQDSNNVALFHIGSHAGTPTYTGTAFEIANPVCVVFVLS